MNKKYEYPENFARFYDTIYCQLRDEADKDYFLSQIRTVTGKVLEFGVGTGSFFKTALVEVTDIYVIDTSSAMIAEIYDKIEVKASKMVTEMVGKPFVIGTNPQVDAQFSIPYTVACALTRGDVFIGDFETEAIHDRQVKALADRVKVSVNPDLPAKDILHAELTIKMKDGRTHGKTINVPLGNPAKAMDAEQRREKFRKNVAYSGLNFGNAKIEELLSMIDSLEDIQDISRMIALMLP